MTGHQHHTMTASHSTSGEVAASRGGGMNSVGSQQQQQQPLQQVGDSVGTSDGGGGGGGVGTRWSGLETRGMKEAKCSLLLQEEVDFDAKIKALPKQRVVVYQDQGYYHQQQQQQRGGGRINPAAMTSSSSTSNTISTTSPTTSMSSTDSSRSGNNGNDNDNDNNNNNGLDVMDNVVDDNFLVDFKGATVLQLEPVLAPQRQRQKQQQRKQQQPTASKTMPVTMTVGGRCTFTSENYQDFRVMMRTKEQSSEMDIAPNGNFDWPDVESLLLCPVCGKLQPVPSSSRRRQRQRQRGGGQLHDDDDSSNDEDDNDDDDDDDGNDHDEYWMVFYPLLQITVMKGTQMTLGTRTICRLTCLNCMDDLLEGLTLRIQPGRSSNRRSVTSSSSAERRGSNRLTFTLSASDVLAEAGSASFLEDGPPRPETHPHVDDVLDAWTLYNLWEHSGAWEALQNDYRMVLSRSMHANPAEAAKAEREANGGCTVIDNPEPRLKERMGRKCGNRNCNRVHGGRLPMPSSNGTNTNRTDADDNDDNHDDNDDIDRNDEQQADTTISHLSDDVVRLVIRCRECHSEFYCSRQCRDDALQDHKEDCIQKQRDRDERREKKSKRIQCDTCEKKFPYTKMKKCSRCRRATYCSVDCQRIDWERHKFVCR